MLIWCVFFLLISRILRYIILFLNEFLHIRRKVLPTGFLYSMQRAFSNKYTEYSIMGSWNTWFRNTEFFKTRFFLRYFDITAIWNYGLLIRARFMYICLPLPICTVCFEYVYLPFSGYGQVFRRRRSTTVLHGGR